VRRGALLLALALVLPSMTRAADALGPLAERYVRLMLAIGLHDGDFIDAYYGPTDWKKQVTDAGRQPEALLAEGAALEAALAATPVPADQLERMRRTYLIAQTRAALTRLRILGGARLDFDAESRALYDAVAPTHSDADFEAALKSLDQLVPGPGPLASRVEAFRQRFVIQRDRLDTVFRAAIEACRQQTLRHLQLPAGEQFSIEYVTGKSWSGYNWYQGNYKSLIQINTDLPIFIDRALDLACHEGYPGHHVYNVLLEHHLVRGRGWQEFSVYPLFSPQSLIAEGTANFGIEVAYPAEARVALERDRLFPLAGLDPSGAAKYYEVQAVLDRLGYAGNEAARRYLNGTITRDQAAEYLVTYSLSSLERARQRVRFFDQYRAYVINYNLGKDMVRAYVERMGGTSDKPAERWRLFGALLSSPRLPSGL
jgi:hypothetical protein